MLNRSASLAMSTSVLKALPGKFDIKRHSPCILYIHYLPLLPLGMFMLVPCFVVWFLVSNLFCNYLAEERMAGSFTLVELWLSVFCVSSS